MQYKLVALGGGGMVDDYRWYGAEEMAAVATCQNWMTDFGYVFVMMAIVEENRVCGTSK